MGLVLLIVFIPALYAWLQSALAVANYFRRISITIVLIGLLVAFVAIVWPLIMWSTMGNIYVFGPPFVYLIFSVIAPFGLGKWLIDSPAFIDSAIISTVAYATFFAVCLLFPLFCGYFFLAPENMSVAALLGIKSYH